MTDDARIAVLEKNVSLIYQALELLTEAVTAQQLSLRMLASQLGLRDKEETPAQLAERMPTQKVATVNGSIELQDIPLDATGWPTEEWAIENCVCETHTARREAKNNGSLDLLGDSGTDGLGQYL